MHTLNRYALKSLLYSFLFISGIILGIVWLSQSMRVLDLIVNKGISLLDFFHITILTLPSLLFFILPITYLLSVIHCIYKIQQDRELVILKTVGISDSTIISPVLTLGAIITLFGFINSAYLMPISQSKFKSMNDYFQNEYGTLLLQEKTFNTQGKLTVYVESKTDSGLLNGVFISDGREAGKYRIISAARGRVSQTQAGPLFELYTGTQQERDTNNKLTMISFDQYTFNIKNLSSPNLNRAKSAVELTIPEIINTMPSEGLPKRNYHSILHQRLTWPTLIISLSSMSAIILIKTKYRRRYNLYHHIKCLILCSVILISSILSVNMINSNLLWTFALYTISAAPFIATIVFSKSIER